MAIYNKAQLIVGSNDITAYVKTLAYNEEAEEMDDTVMGDTTRSSAGGLLHWTIEVEGVQGFGTGATPDNTFATLVKSTASLVWRPVLPTSSSTISAAFPKYSGTGLITRYVPGQGTVGDQHMFTASIVSAGARTRAVAT
jgi:hypothetical protein